MPPDGLLLVVKTAKGRLGGIAVLVFGVLRAVQFVVTLRVVVDRVLQLARNVVISFIEEADQAINLVAGPSCEMKKGSPQSNVNFITVPIAFGRKTSTASSQLQASRHLSVESSSTALKSLGAKTPKP